MKILNDDCMKIMKDYEDNHFDLAIVDPPYGLEPDSLHTNRKPGHGGKLKDRAINKFNTKWDLNPPKQDYFDELMRVSKNQIIWGGNYFGDYLGRTRGIICWDKVQPFPNFSAWEMAWTSFNKVAKIYKFDNRYSGKIHPTQKPKELYDWLLHTYSEPGQKILDTHLGSGSIAISCHYFGVDLVATEIDKEYYDTAMSRIDRETAQKTLF